MTHTIRVVRSPVEEAQWELFDEYPGAVAALFGALALALIIGVIVTAWPRRRRRGR